MTIIHSSKQTGRIKFIDGDEHDALSSNRKHGYKSKQRKKIKQVYNRRTRRLKKQELYEEYLSSED